MEQQLKEYPTAENETPVHFLSEHTLAQIEKADANPFVKISSPDSSIPFIVTPDGGVIADNTANNPKTVLKNFQLASSAEKTYGAGFIDIYHGNKILNFRHVESLIFAKKWRVDDIASALQVELNLYYPGYRVRER